MIKLILCIYLLILCFGAFIALVTFIFDVIKWHDKEVKENIIDSAMDIYSKGGELNGRTGSIGTGGRGYDDNDGASVGSDTGGSDTGSGVGRGTDLTFSL